MTTDPSEPDTFEEETDPAELDVETPAEDAAWQRADVQRPENPEETDTTAADRDASREADPADEAEQARVVELNEDEYR